MAFIITFPSLQAGFSFTISLLPPLIQFLFKFQPDQELTVQLRWLSATPTDFPVHRNRPLTCFEVVTPDNHSNSLPWRTALPGTSHFSTSNKLKHWWNTGLILLSTFVTSLRVLHSTISWLLQQTATDYISTCCLFMSSNLTEHLT